MLRVIQVRLATELGIVNNVPRAGTKVGPPVVSAGWVHTKTKQIKPGVNRAPKENIRIQQVRLPAKTVLVMKKRICEEKAVRIVARTEPVPIVARGRNVFRTKKNVKTVQWASTVVPRRLRAPVVQ